MTDMQIPDQWYEALKRIGGASDAVATAALPVIDAHLRATAASRTDAYGVAWAPSKSGAPILQRAASRDVLQVVRGQGKLSAQIYCRVGGAYARHDLGFARNCPRRAILPDTIVPPKLAAALEGVIDGVLRRIAGAT